MSRGILHSVVGFAGHCSLAVRKIDFGDWEKPKRDAPSQFPADTFFNRSTSDVDKYAKTLSVAPLRIIVWSTIRALKTTYVVTSTST